MNFSHSSSLNTLEASLFLPPVERLHVSDLRDHSVDSLNTTTHSSASISKDAAVSPFKIFSLEAQASGLPSVASSSQSKLASNVTRMFLDERDLMRSLGLTSLKNPLDSVRNETDRQLRVFGPVTYNDSLFALIDALEEEA